MNGWPTVGVAGARGVVGGVFSRSWPMRACRPTAFAPSATRPATIAYPGRRSLCSCSTRSSRRSSIVLFLASTPRRVREIMAGPGSRFRLVVDNSSAFRLVLPSRWSSPRRMRRRPGSNAGTDREPELHHRRGGRRAGPDPRPCRSRVGRPGSYQAVSGAGRRASMPSSAERGSEDRECGRWLPVPRPHRRQRRAPDRRARRDRLDGRGEQDPRRAPQDPWDSVPGCRRHHGPGPGRDRAQRRDPLRTARETSRRTLEAALKAAPGLEYRPLMVPSGTRCRSTSRAATRCSSAACGPSRPRTWLRPLRLQQRQPSQGCGAQRDPVAAAADPIASASPAPASVSEGPNSRRCSTPSTSTQWTTWSLAPWRRWRSALPMSRRQISTSFLPTAPEDLAASPPR